MDTDVMLTVSYSLKIPKDEFWNPENGEVNEEMRQRNLFTAKNKLVKQDEFVDKVKHFYTVK